MSGSAIRLNGSISAVSVPFSRGRYLVPTHVFIVEGEEGLLLIDTGGSGSGAVIQAALAGMGYTVGDIRAIALTHWHSDHTGGLAELLALAPDDRTLPVYIGSGDLPHLESQSWSRLFVHPVLRIPLPHKPGSLPAGLKTRMELISIEEGRNDLNRAWTISPIHTPGHTPGHHAFMHEKTDTLLAGCGLALLSPRTVGIVPVYTDRQMQIESAQRLASMEYTWMYPVHLHLNTRSIRKDERIMPIPVPLTSRLTGALPLFRYPAGQ